MEVEYLPAAGGGIACDRLVCMAGARHYSQLVCWQLADAMRVRVFALTRREPFARDFRHRAQIEDAADSVCRNIAEGFGCRSHVEFARYLEIARRSLNELTDELRSARLKGYVQPEDLTRIHETTRRLYPALGSLIAYLPRASSSKSPYQPGSS